MECFLEAYRKYAVFAGRANRREYWMFFLFYFILSIGLSFVAGFLSVVVGIDVSFLVGLFSLSTIVPSIALATRRLHDISKSGWWQLIGLIPVIGFLLLLYWLAKKGDDGENRFGEPSKGCVDE